MTTISQLTKEAKRDFIPWMESKGFRYHKKLVFSRTIGEEIHQLVEAELGYGENLRFLIVSFVAEYDSDGMKNYPHNISLDCGGRLGEGLICGELWDIASLEHVDVVFDSIIENIEKHALPWFEKVSTREAYVEALYPHFREELIEKGLLEKVLYGANGQFRK